MTSKRSLLDGAVGVGGLSTASFLSDVAHGMIADFMLVGGAILLAARLYLVGREILRDRRARQEGAG